MLLLTAKQHFNWKPSSRMFASLATEWLSQHNKQDLSNIALVLEEMHSSVFFLLFGVSAVRCKQKTQIPNMPWSTYPCTFASARALSSTSSIATPNKERALSGASCQPPSSMLQHIASVIERKEEGTKIKDANFKRLISFLSCQTQYSVFGYLQTGRKWLRCPTDAVCRTAWCCQKGFSLFKMLNPFLAGRQW